MKEKPMHKKQQAPRNNVLPSYESPIIVPLGELAKGSGLCQNGSIPSNNPNKCTEGQFPKFAPPLPECIGGHKATASCTNGRAVGK